ncbi:hypothetical protein SK128_002870 [Halocaridina rubra]|uniref:Uncharacterized protein n=1 Tax=Halocaridina rubra TaxID=373956 RepID=A0AAN8WWZ9_HALRR
MSCMATRITTTVNLDDATCQCIFDFEVLFIAFFIRGGKTQTDCTMMRSTVILYKTTTCHYLFTLPATIMTNNLFISLHLIRKTKTANSFDINDTIHMNKNNLTKPQFVCVYGNVSPMQPILNVSLLLKYMVVVII